MQTVPAFAYLIPLLLLFGFGPVVGLIASAIYATPPMVRNTMLELDRVPAAVREAGLMSGCTRRQQFWQVKCTQRLPQLLVVDRTGRWRPCPWSSSPPSSAALRT